MNKEKETVLTADQYVVAELLNVKKELEEMSKAYNNVVAANTYLTIENSGQQNTLKEIRKFFKLEDSSTLSYCYIKSLDSQGNYGAIVSWEHDEDFEDLLKLFGLEEEYKIFKNAREVSKVADENKENQ